MSKVIQITSGEAEIPVIDFAPFLEGSDSGKQKVATAIREAAERIGFFYVRNAPVQSASVRDAFAATRDFFALPHAQKMEVAINRSHRGFMPIGNGTYGPDVKPNLNESFLMGLDLPANDPDVIAGTPMHGANQWLSCMAHQKRAYHAYFDELMGFGRLLLRASARALSLPETFFEQAYAKPMPFIRAVYYPTQRADRDANEFGSARHTDNGCLTLLAQDDTGGLQVQRRDGSWIDAPPIADTFVINIGDMLMRWTNDRWVSTPHRVVNISGQNRYSMPFFFNPSFDTRVECIDSCLRPGEQPRYEPITWGEYFTAKFDKVYAYRKKAA